MLPATLAEPVPLAVDADGVIRVGGTRVTLDTLVGVYSQGSTPEEIAEAFDVLRLDDVYAVITYYLRHREEVEEYLRRREAEAEKIRGEVEALWPQDGLRERLLARLRR
ncbi:MAG TPA: DUF433 domain-containing protein [Thermoanaerobaculia bacterium]|nr:DUF433 domain-containing protein [Thermoanaerobaculia bacterium]